MASGSAWPGVGDRHAELRQPGLSALALMSVSLALFGCAAMMAPVREPKIVDRGAVSVMVELPSAKTALLKPHEHMERFCAARATDFIAAKAVGAGIGVSDGGAAVKASDSIAANVLALGGRNPAVLITRELIYRACEMAININAEPEQAAALYLEFLKHADTIASKQSGAGSAVAAATSRGPSAGGAAATGDN